MTWDTTWTVTDEVLVAWCADIVRRYSRADVDLFIIRLKRAYDTRFSA
jgi:hypothetical protein